MSFSSSRWFRSSLRVRVGSAMTCVLAVLRGVMWQPINQASPSLSST
ncbi:hypothetical protein KPSA3_05961 [Pseudomonas syringae pv. actinidiae]|uniref:Uncharacterized protein n=1 Tax=Pseudomonas syringae pv. actinidiae TaxID=103796 RepID=A0AAN4Q9N6_PSESF|nr:hypothetical protein KPSA3_05961 [Pseudomonas syringae pv. actinidiae]